jgi:hypothetical protein
VLDVVVVGTDVLGVMGMGGGLSPPAPSSLEPSGIPTRATDDPVPMPLGDEADPAGPAKEPPAATPHVPEAVPVIPPPSNTGALADTPVLDTMLPDEPLIELSIPEEVVVPEIPEEGVPETAVPKDACGSEPPMPAHVVVAIGAIGDVPDVIGLKPGDAISVAPSGKPVGGTGALAPKPSGVVKPSGDGVGTCATADVQPKRAAVAPAMMARVIGEPPRASGHMDRRPEAHRNSGRSLLPRRSRTDFHIPRPADRREPHELRGRGCCRRC